MSPEAVKANNLMAKIWTHALNPDLPHLLHSDPNLEPELSKVLAQMKELNMSESARLMIMAFEKLFIPLCQNVEIIRANESSIESKEAFVKAKLDMVVQVTEEINGLLAMVEEKKQELIPKRNRAAEIRNQISALNKELELITKQEEEINNVINPIQAKAEQMAVDVVAESDAISSVETELKNLMIQVEGFEYQATNLHGELQSFQAKFKHF